LQEHDRLVDPDLAGGEPHDGPGRKAAGDLAEIVSGLQTRGAPGGLTVDDVHEVGHHGAAHGVRQQPPGPACGGALPHTLRDGAKVTALTFQPIADELRLAAKVGDRGQRREFFDAQDVDTVELGDELAQDVGQTVRERLAAAVDALLGLRAPAHAAGDLVEDGEENREQYDQHQRFEPGALPHSPTLPV
jgi:hypothetical protein